jgi:hypothetical protein
VKVKLGNEKHKTKKIMKNLNPRWNEKFFLYAHATLSSILPSFPLVQRALRHLLSSQINFSLFGAKTIKDGYPL